MNRKKGAINIRYKRNKNRRLEPEELPARELEEPKNNIITTGIAVDFNSPPAIPIGFNGQPLKWAVRPEDQLLSLVKGLWLFSQKELAIYRHGALALITGAELKEGLEGQPVAGCQLLEFLLANQKEIPKEWAGKRTFFWTIYRDSRGGQLLRYLVYDGKWTWGSMSLEEKLTKRDQAAVIIAANAPKVPPPETK